MEDERKKEIEQENQTQEQEIKEQKQSPTPAPKKPFPTKIAIIVASAVAVVGIGAVALVGMLGAHNHSFGEWATAKEATCEINGVKERFCSCGEKQTDDIFATGHNFSSWTVVEKATCANEGSENRECSCGERETRSIDKLKTHTEVIDAKVEATCKDTGLTEGKHCSVCGETIIAQEVINKLTTHTYTDKYDAICNVCNYERVPDCAHTNKVTVSGKDATCTEDGLTNGQKCAKCGETLVAQATIKAKGHIKGIWVTDKAATCTEQGIKHQECSVCHATVDEGKISPLGHTESGWITREAPTCTTKGSRYKECTVCHEMIISEPINALGHFGSEWIYDKEPTCTASGTRHKICTVCNNAFSSENVLATGHNYVSYTCTKCNAVQPGVKLVYDFEDLQNIKNNLTATYILMNDIDCEGLAITPIGTNNMTPFTGIFDGRGYTISNYLASNASYIGIFGYNSGTIRNLNVKDFDYDIVTDAFGTLTVGGIVGYNTGLIEKCSVINGDIYISSGCNRLGALLCGESIGTIKNCYVTGNVYITQPYENKSGSFAAGITTFNYGTIEKCFVDATLYSYGKNGGYAILGGGGSYGEAAFITTVSGANSSISDCFVMGSISVANNRAGDISGYCYGNVTITNCFKDENLVLCDSNNVHANATAIALSTISTKNFFKVTVNWDSSIWDFTNVNLANKVYPKLIQN